MREGVRGTDPQQDVVDEESTSPNSCSFCGSVQSEVRQLLGGPAVYICDRCVYICAESIEEDEYEEVIEVPLSELIAEVERAHGRVSSMKMGASPLRCSFCGRSQLQVNKLIAGPGVYVCDQCVRLFVETIKGEPGGPPPDSSSHSRGAGESTVGDTIEPPS